MTDSTPRPALPPGIARGRRAFLAPVWLLAVGMIAAAAFAWGAWRSQATTTVIVLRHAEKQIGAIADAPLSPEGAERAESLARLFGDVRSVGNIEAIYVSDTRRSRDTAAPLARRLGLTPIVRDPRDSKALLRELQQQHRGRIVLVVGHSNTVPELISALTEGRVQVAISDSDYGQAWVISRPTFGPAALVQLHF